MSSFDKIQTRKKRKTKTMAKEMTVIMTKRTATLSERSVIYFSGSRMTREHFVRSSRRCSTRTKPADVTKLLDTLRACVGDELDMLIPAIRFR